MEEFLNAILEVYYKQKIRFPMTAEDQLETVGEFEDHWQFPDCIGSLDGTHIPILTPNENGADYFNYKNWHSVVLLAIADAHYRFLWINAGQPGKCSDGGVWEASSFGRNDRIIRTPYHLVADAAFPISSTTLKPFPGDVLSPVHKNYNYRLSRARMTIESAFGRLKGRFRILLRRCDWEVQKIVKCVIVCCILHNIAEENNEVFMENWLKKVEEFDTAFPQPPQQLTEYHSTNLRRHEGVRKRENLANLLA